MTAPAAEGVQQVRPQVTDARGTSTTASLEVLVQRDGAAGIPPDVESLELRRSAKVVPVVADEGTDLRLPPGLLVAGKTYFLQFTTLFMPGYDPNTPYKSGPESDYITTLTGKFQP